MKSYLLKAGDREEGPLTEQEIAQLYADGTVNRDTPCRLEGAIGWKTIDDYLPMLKYGTQLPAPSAAAIRGDDRGVYRAGSSSAAISSDARVLVVDVEIPFSSMLKLMFKWVAAGFIVSLCVFPVVMLLVFILNRLTWRRFWWLVIWCPSSIRRPLVRRYYVLGLALCATLCREEIRERSS
jgi:hypothetical protein